MIMLFVMAGTIIFLFRGGTTLLFLATVIIVVPLTTGMIAFMITLSVNTETHRLATAAVMFFRLIVIALFSVINVEHRPFVEPPLPATKVGRRDRLALIGVVVRGEPCIVLGGHRNGDGREIDRYRLGAAIGTADGDVPGCAGHRYRYCSGVGAA